MIVFFTVLLIWMSGLGNDGRQGLTPKGSSSGMVTKCNDS